MICYPRPRPHPPYPSDRQPPLELEPRSGPDNPYGLPFWWASLAHAAVIAGVALLFRYADFVTFLGGTELHLGWIVGLGMVGSLLVRLLLGGAIDRYGPRLVWIGSLLLFAASCFIHLGIDNHRGPAIYLVRIALCSSTAGIFGAALTFISYRASIQRMAEMIGMLGTSGFVGMVVGTQLGDMLAGAEPIGRRQLDSMFLLAGGLALLALCFAWMATRGQSRPAPRRRPPMLWLLKRYHPGTVLLVGAAVGAGLGLPATFLRAYAAELGIAKIGLFFAVYAPTAIVTRVLTRRLPERLGLSRMIFVGLGALVLSQFLFLVVRSQWDWIVPAVGYGIAHAILFPATVAAGSRAFPDRYRGLATTLMLASFDAGQLVGAPLAGAIVHFGGSLGLPGYPMMFVSSAGAFAMVGVVYALTGSRQRSPRRKIRPQYRAAQLESTAEPTLVETGVQR